MPGRDSAWRQGSLIVDAHALNLGLVFDDGGQHRVVVISHDCDLANDREPFVECIVADIVATAEPTFTRARNVRRLHLSYTTGEGETLALELRHDARSVVGTAMFDAIAANPDASVTLNADEKRALKQWLAARYGRPAFPNAFENRLRRKHKGKTVEQLTGKLLEPYNAHLVGVFFDLDTARFQDLEDGEPYFLRITVAYDATEGGRLRVLQTRKRPARFPNYSRASMASQRKLRKLLLRGVSPSRIHISRWQIFDGLISGASNTSVFERIRLKIFWLSARHLHRVRDVDQHRPMTMYGYRMEDPRIGKRQAN
ncbi:hypothetical protein VSR82_38830 [Burkholderia sp. JPY481]